MEKELVIQKATYINDRSYIPLTVLAANQQQKYIDLLTSKDAEVANKEMAEKLLAEYLPSVEKILKALTSMEEEASAFNGELEKLYKSALRLTYILRVRFGTLLDFLAGEETDIFRVDGFFRFGEDVGCPVLHRHTHHFHALLGIENLIILKQPAEYALFGGAQGFAHHIPHKDTGDGALGIILLGRVTHLPYNIPFPACNFKQNRL